MDCQTSDSKKLCKVFDASKRKKSSRRDGHDDTNSVATDESNSVCHLTVRRTSSSAKASLQNIPAQHTTIASKDGKRERDSSPSGSPSIQEHRKRSMEKELVELVRPSRSPRRHRRQLPREGISLALKAGLVSTPRSISPHKEAEDTIETVPQDQDSFMYAFLEEAIKRDKRSKRHARHQEESRHRDYEGSDTRRHRHHHRRRCDEMPSRDCEKSQTDATTPSIDQTALFETFAKICAQFNEKPKPYTNEVARTQSHKSLQCEVIPKRDQYDIDQRPEKLQSHEHSRDSVTKIRSHENFRSRHSQEKIPNRNERQEVYDSFPSFQKDMHYNSPLEITASRMRNVEDERYRDYPHATATRSCMNQAYNRPPPRRDYREYDREQRLYEDKRYMEQKASRSFDVHRERYMDDDKHCRRTARSDNNKEKWYSDRDRRYDERDKFYDERRGDLRERSMNNKDRRSRRNIERFERISIASRDEDYRERDRYSERERDSGLSVADGENSTVSGKSNYLRVVKQEIAEQREAMDKMMKLWKELMRCFKGISSQTQGQEKAVHDSAASVRDSAAAQLRLWRECMRRYETVARDVGDTDARLMEEISKQRSEMTEMASMWQECLQRYREMSTDFNNLKQKVTAKNLAVAPSDSPTRLPAPPLVCAEGEGNMPMPQYRMPLNYLPGQMPQMPSGYNTTGSPVRVHSSAPPAWWWNEAPRHISRRRSSPESRGSRERDRRHRHKDRDRDDGRYKEKTTKPSAARSEHRHRKR